ncbi:MAG: hypothetical protein HY805_04200 [Nitrospirae bacterium]|nr:hypothetical protein [Nitrospirota bacterium]
MKRITLIVVFLLMPLVAHGNEKFGMVFDIQGTVEVKTSDGRLIKLRKDRHVLYPIKDGDRINVMAGGRVVIVSIKGKQGYEILSNSSVEITEGRIRTIKGTVNIKEGFHAPEEGAGGQIGAVVLRSSIKEPCIRTVSPVNTSILDLTPELVWRLDCKGIKKVSVRILTGKDVIFSRDTEVNSMKVPEGILKYGETYRWLVDGGPVGIFGGTFLIPEEQEVKNINEKIASLKAGKDLSERLSYVFYLLGNGLNEHAKSEIELLEREFPENEYIRELKK